MAGATTLGDLASAIGARSQEEAAIVAELKAGSETAYAWLIGEFQQPVYGLVYRIVNDPADAADTTQDVFLKVFRGMKQFHGGSSLKTWIYRIALHEAANRRRWWFRHKAKETSIEPVESDGPSPGENAMQVALTDHAEVLEISLGTVKSRLTRGRDALRQRLSPYVREVGNELGLTAPTQDNKHDNKRQRDDRSLRQVAGGGRRVEVSS